MVPVKQEESDDESTSSEMRSEKRNPDNLKSSVSYGSARGALNVDPSPEQGDSDDQDELMLVAEVCKEYEMAYCLI